jgi:hypothetical protein
MTVGCPAAAQPSCQVTAPHWEPGVLAVPGTPMMPGVDMLPPTLVLPVSQIQSLPSNFKRVFIA